MYYNETCVLHIFHQKGILSPLPQVNRIRGERVEKRTYKTIENNR